MNKILCLLLVVGSMSAFSMSNRCAKAEVSVDNLGVVMSTLNKNGIKYSVSKRGYSSYSIVARAKSSASRRIDRSISRLVSSPMMKNLGVQFRRLDMRKCNELKSKLDLSRI